MYDSYPEHDVPQNNIIQRFFGQRWSAIVIEVLLTIVITVAAGQAFEFFVPFDSPVDTVNIDAVEEFVPPEAQPTSAGISLNEIGLAAANYLENGQYAEAEAMVDLLITAQPKNATTYRIRAIVNEKLSDFAEAYRDASMALEMAPERAPMHVSLCWYAGELGEYEVALEHCNAVLDLAIDQFSKLSAIENRCWVYVEMADYEAAWDDCNTVLREDSQCNTPLCYLAHYNLGRIMAALGDNKSAQDHFESAFELAPAFEYVYPRMYLEMAKFYDTLGNQRVALLNYEKYIGIVGKNADPVAQSRVSALQDED